MNYFIRSNYFIGLAVLLQTLATFSIVNNYSKTALFYSLAMGFGTKWLYTLLRKGDTILSYSEAQKFVVTQAFPIVCSAIFWILSKPTHIELIGLSFCFVLSLLYGMHIFGNKAQQWSLRQPGWIKLVSICVVWTAIVVVFPFLRTSHFLTNKELVFALMQLLWLMCLTLPFDFSDSVEQERLGFSTIASLYGLENARKIGRGLAIFVWIASGFYSLSIFILMSQLILLYLRFLNSDLKKWDFSDYTLRFDGLLILQATGIILFAFFEIL